MLKTLLLHGLTAALGAWLGLALVLWPLFASGR